MFRERLNLAIFGFYNSYTHDKTPKTRAKIRKKPTESNNHPSGGDTYCWDSILVFELPGQTK
jgi:hypothetical protein